MRPVCAALRIASRLLGCGFVDVRYADLRTFVREEERCVAAHAAAGSGDHDDLAVEPPHGYASVAT